MKLKIEVEFGNDAMDNLAQARRAIDDALHRHIGRAGSKPYLDEDGGKVMDLNGNTVGHWEVVSNG